jgi:hypothetical protein
MLRVSLLQHSWWLLQVSQVVMRVMAMSMEMTYFTLEMQILTQRPLVADGTADEVTADEATADAPPSVHTDEVDRC